MVTRLRATFEYIRVFDDILPFTSYILKENIVANVVAIISSVLHGPSMCYLVEQQAKTKENKLREPYVFLFEQTNKSFEHLVFTSIDELFIKIGSDIECHPQCSSPTKSDVKVIQSIDESKESYLLPPLGVLNSSLKQNSFRHLSNESLRFIQFQSLVEILFRMDHDETSSKDDMLSTCREYYANDIVELAKIKEFQDNYTARNVIAYYTDDSFCFRMVNRAFRSEDIEHIFVYRLFITDLHKELARRANEKQKIQEDIVVYRGKKLPNTILQQLKDNVHGLISMNGFLSTTKNETTAKAFSGDDVMRDNYQSVIFELHIQKISSYTGKPFADIFQDNNEMNEEQEVLFSVGTVWRIKDVGRIDHLWYIKLTSCSDIDNDLRQYLTNLNDGYTLLSIGNLLQELGENAKAENFYRQMLKNEPNVTVEDKGFLHYHIGILRAKEGDYHGAIDALNKAIPYFPLPAVTSEKASCLTTLITNTDIPNYRFAIYFNIGMGYLRTSNRKEAKEAWEHALVEKGSPEDMAKVNKCLGELAHICGNFKEAAEYHKTASESIIKSSASKEVKHDYKRKYDEAIQLSNQIDERSKPKRQRTRSGIETPK